MFVRYLGGGIGHLEQFPSAENNGEEPTMKENGDAEAETDNFLTDETNNNDNEGNGGKEVGESEDEEEDDEEVEGGEEDDDPGESSDEETGNVY